MRYQTRPRRVEAEQWQEGQPPPDPSMSAFTMNGVTRGILHTPYGAMHLRPGDYVTTDPDGSVLGWAREVFEGLYAPAEEGQS